MKFARLLIVVAVILLSNYNAVSASTLSCAAVEGMAIFGYKYGEWEFIGAIANEFDSDSIANEFGAGNEFSSDSIFNEFGSFGSEFSSYSAFNEFAGNPPIIVNDSYKFVGYLTINDFKTPNINTYEAIACAKNSFRSFSNSDLEDTVFKSIPSGGYSGSSGYSQQDLESLLKSSCPNNATYSNGQCLCNDGYVANGSVCVTHNQSCQLKYGLNSYGDKEYCYCSSGYEFNANKTSCIQSLVCPANTTKVGTSCICNEGFVLKNGQCITYTADCKLSFGDYVVGSKGDAGNSSCNCEAGYVWNTSQTACIKPEVKPVSLPPEPIKKNVEVSSTKNMQNEKPSSVIEKQIVEEKPSKNVGTTSSLVSEPKEQVSKSERQGFFSKIFGSIKNSFSNLFK